MSLIKQQLYNTMNAREQLMEDIDGIIEEFHLKWIPWNIDHDTRDDLTRALCDAVCYNFPTTMYSISELEQTAIDPMGIGK